MGQRQSNNDGAKQQSQYDGQFRAREPIMLHRGVLHHTLIKAEAMSSRKDEVTAKECSALRPSVTGPFKSDRSSWITSLHSDVCSASSADVESRARPLKS